MQDPRQHAAKRPWLEELVRHIPGFKGYLEKEYRRESDALQRKFLAEKLRQAKRTLDDYARGLVEAGQLDGLTHCDRARAKLDALVGRVSGAMQGYSGVFDLVRIDEAVLERVYEHDAALTSRVELLNEAAAQLGAQPPEQAFTSLLDRIADLERAWTERTDILQGLS